MRKDSANKRWAEMEVSGPYDLLFQEADEHGDPVERSKQQFPYSYSAYVTWRKPGTTGPGAHAVYSDRLFQWDSKKHDSLCLKHFGNIGQMWTSRAPAAMEAFLRDYFGKEDLELQLVMEGCNPSNGYPYWVFYYRHTNG
jgi:hypothetical protein